MPINGKELKRSFFLFLRELGERGAVPNGGAGIASSSSSKQEK